MKININDRNVFFSSDWHLNHTNIVTGTSQWSSGGQRDFETVELHNSAIIDSINEVVKENDILFILGDFAFGNKEDIPSLRNRINCKEIHFIYGNHDHHIRKKYQDVFTSCSDYREIILVEPQPIGKAIKHHFVLSHYPYLVWNGHQKGYSMIFGHTHDSLSKITPEYFERKVFEVGVDVAKRLFGDYRPFTAEYIISQLSSKRVYQLDHHDENTNVG